MKEIKLTNGGVTQVDDEDYARLLGYTCFRVDAYYTSYAVICIGGKEIKLHDYLLGVHGQRVDHRDGDGLNNQRNNIRQCTPSQNGQNRKRRRDGSSRFKGVRKVGSSRTRIAWSASIRVDRKPISLGVYNNEEEAARAYDAAARKYFKDYACTNFPKGEERAAI